MRVEQLAEDEYLVTVPGVDGDVLIRLTVDAGAASSFEGVDALLLVRAVMAYLLERQDAEELPAELDLADVAAAYDDFEESVLAAVT